MKIAIFSLFVASAAGFSQVRMGGGTRYNRYLDRNRSLLDTDKWLEVISLCCVIVVGRIKRGWDTYSLMGRIDPRLLPNATCLKTVVVVDDSILLPEAPLS